MAIWSRMGAELEYITPGKWLGEINAIRKCDGKTRSYDIDELRYDSQDEREMVMRLVDVQLKAGVGARP
jgi:hypothetical protein